MEDKNPGTNATYVGLTDIITDHGTIQAMNEADYPGSLCGNGRRGIEDAT
jgi:hypothetical protein